MFRCVQLTVPGNCFEDGVARTGWYVGLSYWTDKEEIAGVKGERIGENDVNQGNDWILKIVPGETTPTPPTPPSPQNKPQSPPLDALLAPTVIRSLFYIYPIFILSLFY